MKEHRAALAEKVARAFHAHYERLAPDHGYRTREASAKPWDEVPKNNRALMVATALAVIEELELEVVRTATIEDLPMLDFEAIEFARSILESDDA